MTAFNPITAREDASSVGLRKTRRAGQSVLELIGNTPLLRLSRISNAFPNVEFFAKAEWFNPGGSVKDRPALPTSANASLVLLEPSSSLLRATRVRTALSGEFTRLLRRSRTNTFTRINTAIRPIGRRIMAPPRTRFGSRPAGALLISWRHWEPAAHLSALRAD